MTGVGSLIMAVVLSALAGYLITRIVVIAWGVPRIPRKVLAALEVAPAVPRSRGSRSDLAIILVIFLLLEAAAIITISDAVRAGDGFTAVVFFLQFVVAAAWWFFLRSRLSRG